MNATIPHADTRALYSQDGKTWQDGSAVTWPDTPDPEVSKIVIGTPFKAGDEPKTIDDLPEIPENFAALYPNLTHLHLWQIDTLTMLPELPSALNCLDVRGCSMLRSVRLPSTVETLVLEFCPELSINVSTNSFPSLIDFSAKGSGRLTNFWINSVVSKAAALRFVNMSACPQFTGVDKWPSSVERIELNDCAGVKQSLTKWPNSLVRLGVRNCSNVVEIADFLGHASEGRADSPRLDYLDLSGTSSLQRIPVFPETLRTLFIFGSGLSLPPELFGSGADHNVASKVHSHLAEKEYDRIHGNVHGFDKEVKVILLGNGRCGKSSIANRLVNNEFDENADSTHGIQLWTTSLPFNPVGAASTTDDATLNIWDFGGQDLYHNTHRLFLQSKAVYVICLTNHGDGFDQNSDSQASDKLLPGEDERRDLTYWRQQIASLGLAPGMQSGPPVLVVRTKCDRDVEPTSPHHFTVDLEVSARTAAGFPDLRKWLAKAVAEVLGPPDRRDIGSRRLAVKRELQELKEANHHQHEESKDSDLRTPPPYPLIAYEEFVQIVRRHCLDGPTHNDPRDFLDFLHQSGFLYYHKKFLSDRVILDQRWVIKGMYTVFDREKCWPRLNAKRGRFTLSELRDWVWSAERFTESEQLLFLDFMQACGICFVLLNAWEATVKETVYLAPAALPLVDDVAEDAAAHRDGLPLFSEPVVLADELLGRDSILQLLIQLGHDWRRAPVLWRWGGQFQSFRTRTWQGELTFLHLDWKPFSNDSFGGALTFTQYGTDHTFLSAVLKECDGLAAFGAVKDQLASALQRWNGLEIPVSHEVNLADERVSASDIRNIEAHKPTATEAVAVEIGISYAGDGQPADAHWENLPVDSIERWPRALKHRLQQMQFKVEEFRVEQSRDHVDQEVYRKSYLDRLTDQDFMVAFLSWDYLRSPWCMYELLRVIRKSPKEEVDPKTLRLAVFPNARMSQTQLTGEVAERPAKLREHWKSVLEQFRSRVMSDAPRKNDCDYHSILNEARAFAYAEWMDLVADESAFNSFLKQLRNWNVTPVDYQVDEKALNDWAEQAARLSRRADVLFDFAARAWESGNRQHAKQLFRLAFDTKDPDRQQGGIVVALRKKIGINTLDDIRREVLEDLQSGEGT